MQPRNVTLCKFDHTFFRSRQSQTCNLSNGNVEQEEKINGTEMKILSGLNSSALLSSDLHIANNSIITTIIKKCVCIYVLIMKY